MRFGQTLWGRNRAAGAKGNRAEWRMHDLAGSGGLHSATAAATRRADGAAAAGPVFTAKCSLQGISTCSLESGKGHGGRRKASVRRERHTFEVHGKQMG